MPVKISSPRRKSSLVLGLVKDMRAADGTQFWSPATVAQTGRSYP